MSFVYMVMLDDGDVRVNRKGFSYRAPNKVYPFALPLPKKKENKMSIE